MSGKNVKKIIFLVATFKNILCIPIACKYFIFVVSMAMREKNQSHVAVHYLR
jgi:hypothetical protein